MQAQTALSAIRVWPSFEPDIEKPYLKFMLPYRVKTTLIYGLLYCFSIASAVFTNLGKPSFAAQVCLAGGYCLALVPMLGLVPV